MDDCFILWKEDLDKLQAYTSIQNTHNSINNQIQFTMEYSYEQLPFLDILVKLKDGIIATDIYITCQLTQNSIYFFNHVTQSVRASIYRTIWQKEFAL